MKKLEAKDMQSTDIIKQNIEKLKELFPEVFSEDKIKFEQLEELLGNYTNKDEDHYNFTWYGKRAAGRLAQTPSTGTLRPAKDESVDFDNTQNLFIEGDNLEVLKLLQKSYHRKVKMIYIDPPYNTGNDFVYEDDFKDGVKHYLEMTGQTDNDGKKLGTNSESKGRYHTNWLNMMYPRLKLARNLLQDDGVIFISIDDNQQANLKKLCDEVFGEANFIACNIWVKKSSPQNDAKTISPSHDYVLCYSKDINQYDMKLLPRDEKQIARFKNSDNDPRGPWTAGDLTSKTKAAGHSYPVISPAGKEFYPTSGRQWAPAIDTYKKWLEEGRIWFGVTGDSAPKKKQFLSEIQQGIVPMTLWGSHLAGDNTSAARMLKNMEIPFETPKPIQLIQHAMKITIDSNDIVLDFFAGSGTTAHATMQLNAEDGGNRKCISVQLPEKTNEKSEAFKAGYKNIAEISKERIRRAAKKIKQENPDYKCDLGFKVFKLDSSNIKRWEAGFDSLKEDLIASVDYIKKDRSNEDIVFEILLKYGLDLTLPIETRKIAGKEIYIIGLGALIICLDNGINMEVVNGICTLKEELSPEIMRVVFSDSGFRDDVIKTNAITTLKRSGIEDIKSL